MTTILEVKGVGPAMAAELAQNGIATRELLASRQVADLLVVPGVGAARAAQLIAAAREMAEKPTLETSIIEASTAETPVVEVPNPATDAGAASATVLVSLLAAKETKAGAKLAKKGSAGKLADSGKARSGGAKVRKALKKDVKKREAVLEKQKIKLKQAKKALKKAS